MVVAARHNSSCHLGDTAYGSLDPCAYDASGVRSYCRVALATNILIERYYVNQEIAEVSSVAP